MKVINKFLVVILTFCMLFALVGCVDDNEPSGKDGDDDKKIDFDLTAMEPNMTYAMFQNLNLNTDEYLNKRFKIPGTYYLSEGLHTVWFSDACCSEYIEFKLKNADAEYPDSYDYVIITGVGGQRTIDGVRHFYLYNAEIVGIN